MQFEVGEAAPQGFFPHVPFAVITVGTYDNSIAQALEQYASHVPLHIGLHTLHVLYCMALPDIDWQNQDSLSVACYPIALRDHATGHSRPLFARDAEWLPMLAQNLAHKARQFLGTTIDPADIAFQTHGGWQARFQRPYGYPIPAFQPRKELRVTAPPAIYDVLYTFGFGILNSAGLGGLTVDALTLANPQAMQRAGVMS
ncbi:MAG: CRISPR-associated endoribonuclease Cas6 [Sulfobacillus sp.]